MGMTGIGRSPANMGPLGPRPPRPAPASLAATSADMGAFLNACETGELEDIRWFLKYYPDQWGCHRFGKTGLMYAAEHGCGAAVRLLLAPEYAAWANVNGADKQGMTALLYAAESGHPYVVTSLLEKKAAPTINASTGRNALHLAALNGHTETLELFLPLCLGVIDRIDERGETPLSLAAAGGKPRAVRLLLDNGAKLGTVVDGKTMIDIAKSCGHSEIAAMLEEEPVRRDAAISAAVDGGISGGMKLRGPVTLLKKKAAEKFSRPEAQAGTFRTPAKLQKPTFP